MIDPPKTTSYHQPTEVQKDLTIMIILIAVKANYYSQKQVAQDDIVKHVSFTFMLQQKQNINDRVI